MQTLWSELNDGRFLSPKLWKGFAPPVGNSFPTTPSGNPCIGFYDDFINFSVVRVVTSNAGTYMSNGIQYESFEDDAGIAQGTPSATTAPGEVTIQPGTHDNDTCSLQAKGVWLNPIYTSAKDFVFETRFKVSSIAASSTDLFIGLAGTGAAANDGIGNDTSGTMASNNFLGFTREGTATSGLTFVIQRVGGTQQEHASMGTLVADTYIKAGFRFHYDRRKCTVWIDGANVHEVTAAQVAATPWPTLFMNFAAEMKYQATSAHILTIDWWACAQLL